MNRHGLLGGILIVVVAIIAWRWSTPRETESTATSGAPASSADSTPTPTSELPPTRSVRVPATVTSQTPPAPAPDATVRARVTVDGRVYDLTPNQVGSFPRLLVPANARVPVTMTFAAGDVGEPVAVVVQDSGKLVEDDAVAGLRRLDAARQVQFTAQMRDEAGIYRVSVRKGGEMQVLEFWVGEELPVRGESRAH